MSSSQNWNEMGHEIRQAVEESIRSCDFSNLGKVFSDTINSVVDEAKFQAKQVRDSVNTQSTRQQYTTRSTTFQRNGRSVTFEQRQQSANPRPYRFEAPRVLFRRKGDISSVLFTVFGGIGTGLTTLGLLIFVIIAVAVLSPLAGLIGSVIIAILMGGSIGMLAKGASNRKRLARAERYLAIAHGHDYVNIAELALQTGKSEAYVRKDVKNMLFIGMFPQGHLDRLESCLMLSDQMYREYLEVERRRAALGTEAKAASATAKQGNTNEAAAPAAQADGKADSALTQEQLIWRQLSGIDDPGEELEKENPALAAMIHQGQECTGHIRQMNDRIPGEIISKKLSALEQVLKEIFQRVREHPKQMEKMQKFMDYYLPTTLKLVEAYEEFDSIPTPNEEILQAKNELEKTIDTINESFAQLLNQMYQESVLDATTDAKVLQTMLAKDGLSGDHAFDKIQKQ